MHVSTTDAGRAELRAARRESRGLFWLVALFSIFVNLLLLTGPLYMLQVYDRVLGSRSEATLLALTLLAAFLYATMGVLDYTRGRIMARVGARFQDRLDRRVFEAALSTSGPATAGMAATAQRDLEAIQRLLSSPALLAVFDLPWTPLFLACIALFHPWLGALALAGGGVLVLFSLLNQQLSRVPLLDATRAGLQADTLSDQLHTEAEMIQSLGMRSVAFHRWQSARSMALRATNAASDTAGTFAALGKSLRLFLQSAMLGLGAYLVLQDEMTAGAMVASSILMGRALAPIEHSIAHWPVMQRGIKGWQNLAHLLSEIPATAPLMSLPAPKAALEVRNLTVIPPNATQPALRSISFDLHPGQALGVIGPSGAGKTTLARALTGHWAPTAGKLRLDGAALDHYAADQRGLYIGYLPQRVQLFEGTIAENIARLTPDPDPETVVSAARAAAAHEMILQLPDGYETRITPRSSTLSGGQLQRIGLARALYGRPVLLVLDEPNSNLDNDGSAALNAAIRHQKAAGKSVIIMAHRPAAIQECDALLILKDGAATAYGPRDEVLKTNVKNYAVIQGTAAGNTP